MENQDPKLTPADVTEKLQNALEVYSELLGAVGGVLYLIETEQLAIRHGKEIERLKKAYTEALLC
jgi:hypothetical protein